MIAHTDSGISSLDHSTRRNVFFLEEDHSALWLVLVFDVVVVLAAMWVEGTGNSSALATIRTG